MKKNRELITAQTNFGLFKDTIREDAEAITRVRTWIVALRSGLYKQGKQQLCQIGPLKYCCLGVANVICHLGETDWQCLAHTYNQLHLQCSDGKFGYDQVGSLCRGTLTDCNDDKLWDFNDIATFLENQLNAVLTQPARIAQ